MFARQSSKTTVSTEPINFRGGFASAGMSPTDIGYMLNQPREQGTTATKMKAARRARKVLKGQNYLQLRGKY